MKKILGTILTISLGLGMIAIGIRQINGESHSSSKSNDLAPLTRQIQQDLYDLANENKLPPEWLSIYEVRTITTSQQTSQWAKDAQEIIKLNSMGKFRLESTLIAESPEAKESRLMIQFELFDRKTDNKVWEIVRIYQP